MAIKTNFEDPAPGNGVFVGDLRYGRCYGKTHHKHNDYPAAEGEQYNAPAVPLILVQKRDPRIWTGKVKPPKVKHNSKSFTDEIMLKLHEQTGGLLHNLRTIKLGNRISVVK